MRMQMYSLEKDLRQIVDGFETRLITLGNFKLIRIREMARLGPILYLIY